MIECTTNYGMFRHHRLNRDFHERVYTRLKKSFETHGNLLSSFPIIVNEKMEIIDGQHRFAIAKEKKLELYYQILTGAEAAHILACNNRTEWDIEDRLKFYINGGLNEVVNPDYVKLGEFADTFKIKVSTAIAFLGYPVAPTKAKEDFKKGKFVFPKEYWVNRVKKYINNINEIVWFISEKKMRPEAEIKKQSFMFALFDLFETPGFDYPKFLRKLDLHVNGFHNCATRPDYYEMLISIYQYGSKNNRSNYMKEVI